MWCLLDYSVGHHLDQGFPQVAIFWVMKYRSSADWRQLVENSAKSGKMILVQYFYVLQQKSGRRGECCIYCKSACKRSDSNEKHFVL